VLTITDRARAVLRRIPQQPTLPDTAGLRIARNEARQGRYRVTAVPEPRHDDRVLEDQGARVFLGPVAAVRLRGRTLDARRDRQGRIEFVLTATS
jgi:Fe-S cluster assembly iron-binding protein IscA